MPKVTRLLAPTLLSLTLAACASGQGAAPAASAPTGTADLRSSIENAARSLAVQNLNVQALAGGALDVTGQLSGLPFAARFPGGWNGEAVLFAHGYVAPQAQEPVPSVLEDPSGGMLTAAYAEGYATASSAYAKTGYAVRSGVDSTLALKTFLDRVGAKRAYIAGASMGGNIAVALVEKYPNQFAGALPYCGVVAGWAAEERYLLDFRVVYDALTQDLPSPIPLPGAGHALNPGGDFTSQAVQRSVAALFIGAQSSAQLQSVIAQIARVTGAQPDPISFYTALNATTYSLQDLLSTQGGNGYSNVGRVYAGSLDDAALNRSVERLQAVPAASAYLNAWYTPNGHFTARMLSVHNTSDPLVPYLLESAFGSTVAAAGNSANLVQQVVDPKPVNLADIANSGPEHCYFSAAELTDAWNELRAWVEQGVKPEGGLNITHK